MVTLQELHIDTKGPFSRVRARARGQRYRRYERRDLKKLFLQRFRWTANVTQSCQSVGVSRNTVYRWMRQDADFHQRYESLCNRFWPPIPDVSIEVGRFEELVSSMSDRQLMQAMRAIRGRRY